VANDELVDDETAAVVCSLMDDDELVLSVERD